MNKFINSQQLLERAKKVTPLGAQTFSKSYRYFCEGVSPAFLDRGQGCYVWDVDNNQYIDFICALGPVTIGYNDSRINSVIIEQLSKGISFPLSSRPEVELAEKLVHILPGAEMVRFVKNGSDATTAAVRLARAYTGRDIIAMSGYHGMHDWSIGASPNNRGVPSEVSKLTKVFEYNNLESLEKVLSENYNKVAAIILEPIQGNGPKDGYLQGVRGLADKYGALLIFDEVVSGFRYALGGAAELYGVAPDLGAYGKGMGNGMPISAVVGRADILRLIEEGIFVSTTFGGDALSIVAALETIKILEQPGSYKHIWDLGTQMLDGLNDLINSFNLNEVINTSGLPPHAGVMFEGIGSLSYLDINSVFQQRMIEQGILSVGINNISLSHTHNEVESYISAAKLALEDISLAIEKDSIEEVLKGGKVNPVFKRNIK